MQKSIICIFINGKKSIFAPEKSLKLPKILFFFQSKNCIFDSFKLFSWAKIDFFAIFENANNAFLHFWNCTFFLILEHCVQWHGQSSCYSKTIWPSIGKINSLQHAKMLSKIDNFFNHFWYFWTHFFLEGGVVIVEGYFSNMSENILFDKIIELQKYWKLYGRKIWKKLLCMYIGKINLAELYCVVYK